MEEKKVLKSVKNILNGWQNFISKNEISEKIAKERALKCKGCVFAVESKTIKAFIKDEIKEVQGFVCDKCKCPLSAKIRSQNEKCPKKEW